MGCKSHAPSHTDQNRPKQCDKVYAGQSAIFGAMVVSTNTTDVPMTYSTIQWLSNDPYFVQFDLKMSEI